MWVPERKISKPALLPARRCHDLLLHTRAARPGDVNADGTVNRTAEVRLAPSPCARSTPARLVGPRQAREMKVARCASGGAERAQTSRPSSAATVIESLFVPNVG